MRTLKKAYLEITNVCNLRCSFCPGSRRPQGFLTLEQFRILAGRLRPHTQYLYLHLMGEPLLHPQLEQLLETGEELGFRIMITTNGTLLSKWGELLCSSPAVHRVSISLHSFEGNEGGDEDLGGYLDGCFAFAQQAAEAGKLIVMTTQVPNEGSDLTVYHVGGHLKSTLRLLEAYDMTTEAAVAKLMWIMGQTREFSEVERLFYQPVAQDILRFGDE